MSVVQHVASCTSMTQADTLLMKLISWNLAHRDDAWRCLLDSGADVALVQEAGKPPSDVKAKIEVDGEKWATEGAGSQRQWRTAVVRLTDNVKIDWFKPRRIGDAGAESLTVSCLGTLTAARVTLLDGTSYLLVSMYAPWERPHVSTGGRWIYADASAHRVISDLSALIGQQRAHRMIAAGDLNILYGYGDYGSRYWAGRYKTVFDRMSALGLSFVGPQAPAGRLAEPWPDELPKTSRDLPTYRSTRQTAATATRQLDFVFASTPLVERIRAKAINEPSTWGPSDHCRIEIEVAE